MHSFLITAFQDKPGLQYYYASWPMFDPVTKRCGRGRKKFTTRGEAEEFLAGVRLEFRKNADVILAHDRVAQLDFLRARDVLKGLPIGFTLEKAALLLVRCQSGVEKRDGQFEAPEPKDRLIELGPREWLAVRHYASQHKWTESAAVATIIHRWLLALVEADVAKRALDEKLELARLQERTKCFEALQAGWRHEGQQAAYEAGRLAGIAQKRALQAKRSRESYHRQKQKLHEQRRKEAIKEQVDRIILKGELKARANAAVR
jgi:hypothetical protein